MTDRPDSHEAVAGNGLLHRRMFLAAGAAAAGAGVVPSGVSAEPLPVITPVYREAPSVNNGSCEVPFASDEAVVVTEAALTVAAPLASPVICNVEPDGLENCRWLPPSAAFNCETTDAIPPEKLTPICFGFALGRFCSGSAVGSVTLTIEICCWVLFKLFV